MNGERLKELVSSKDNCHSCTTYYFPSYFHQSRKFVFWQQHIITRIFEKKIYQDKGLPVNYDKFVSAQDDGRVWKKIIKMWERNFVLWQITFLTWEKISQDR